MDSCGRGIEEKEESIISVNVQSIKMKYISNYCVQRCDIYAPIPSICNQSIPIDINLSIDCYWKSIPIDNHTNLSHRWVIDYPYQLINWYRLVSIIKFIDWIPWDSTTHDIICAKNTRWLQSGGICNEKNTQKRSCWHCNIWPDWCTSYQSHYLQWHTRVYKETFDVNSYIAQTMQNPFDYLGELTALCARTFPDSNPLKR